MNSDVLAELPAGELVETMLDVSSGAEWFLVRAPLEDEVQAMSDKPLEYRDGWLLRPALDRAEHQLGDSVAARIDVTTHPVVNAMKSLPPWRDSGVPDWVHASVAELYTGKVTGVTRHGRFLVQRPSGAVPERVASEPEMLLVPKERARLTFRAGLVGFAIAVLAGTAFHGRRWAKGERFDVGKMAWPQLVGWALIGAVFISPLATVPCIIFTNSQGSTALVVAWINLLLYNDYFGE